MRNGSSRLRLPLRLLAFAAGLLLLSLVAMQSLPWLRGRATETNLADTVSDSPTASASLPPEPMPAAEDHLTAEAASPLSGSAAGGELRSQRSRSERRPATIDVTLHQAQADSVPMPPAVPLDDELPEEKIRQLQKRLDDLEQESADWKLAVTASSQVAQRDDDGFRQQLQDHQLELRNLSQQIAVLEERLRTVQEELKSAEPSRSAPRSEEQPAARISIRKVTEQGKSHVALFARDASLTELLARLGEMSGVNLLVAPDISGSISLHLRASNCDEALEAICRTHHCQQQRTGNIVLVSREPLNDKQVAKTAAPETITKLYRLEHLSGPEIRPYVQALLTPGLGTVSFTTIRERVARTEYRDPPRAILVKDTAQVISDVDRLILELDRPPVKGKALRPLTQTPAATPPVLKSAPASRKQPAASPKFEPVALPPSEAWPTRRPVSSPPPMLTPPGEAQPGPALLPTGTDLPGPCLDDEDFEPPLVQEESTSNSD